MKAKAMGDSDSEIGEHAKRLLEFYDKKSKEFQIYFSILIEYRYFSVLFTFSI